MVAVLSAFYPMTGVTEQLAQWQLFAPNYMGDGVLAGQLNQFSVVQSTPAAMTVGVNTGRAFLQGVFGVNGTITTVAIAAADNTNPRIDRVVLRVDTVANDMELVVLTGNPAVSPTAAALIRSATQTDYSLAQVLVGTTVTTIVTANITDERTWASFRGIPQRATQIASSGTINPFGPSPLTEGHLWCQVTGTTTIANVSPGANPPQSGGLLILEFQSAGCTVNSTGNIKVPRTYVSGTAAQALLVLMWDASAWVEISRSGEQVAGGQVLAGPAGTTAGLMVPRAFVLGDLPTASPNLILAGPVSGTAAGAITARAFDVADLPPELPHAFLAGPSIGTAVGAMTARAIQLADFPSVNPNVVLAGPATGTATAVVTQRALVALDLPVYGTFAVASVLQAATSVSFTTTEARFAQFGKTALISMNLTMTSAGTPGAAVLVTLPAALAMLTSQSYIGNGFVNHAGTVYVGAAILASTTSFNIIASSQANFIGATPSFALGSADQISVMITPELA